MVYTKLSEKERISLDGWSQSTINLYRMLDEFAQMVDSGIKYKYTDAVDCILEKKEGS